MKIGRTILFSMLAATVLGGQFSGPWQLGCVWSCCRQAKAGETATEAGCCRKKKSSCCEQREANHGCCRPHRLCISTECRCGKAPAQPVAQRTQTVERYIAQPAVQTLAVSVVVEPRRRPVVDRETFEDLPPPAWVRHCALLL